MLDTVIITDSSCDLPLDFIENNKVTFLGLVCHFKNEDIIDDFGKTLNLKDFYNALREGEMPTTSQINIFRFTELFKQIISSGKSIIYIGFSSALSGCINSALIAKETILEENKDADITIIDTKCASIGQGILVYTAYKMLENGCSKDEIVKWVYSNMLYVNHWFVVDSLTHLKHGGRISASTALIGSMLNIKPVLKIDLEGRIVSAANIRGRKKAIKFLLENFKENAVNPENLTVAISHGDCIEDATALEATLREEFNVKNIIIGYVGPVIGSHVGPNMLSLCFIGRNR